MQTLTHRNADRNTSAAAIFCAGLPDFRHGRILTCGSDIDCHKHKPAVIRERLRRERLAAVRP